jgi:hypothetical protein
VDRSRPTSRYHAPLAGFFHLLLNLALHDLTFPDSINDATCRTLLFHQTLAHCEAGFLGLIDGSVTKAVLLFTALHSLLQPQPFCNHQSVPTTRRPHNRGNCKGDCKSKSGWGATVAGVGPTKDFICGLQSHVKDPCSTKLTPSFAATFFFSFRAFFAPTSPPVSATSGMTQETPLGWATQFTKKV